jgi:FtsP/CotA-like multicopper oxidase with cupredoxin domain
VIDHPLTDRQVPGVTQWPIEPRSAFTYEIKLNGNQTGSYWYHGHFGAVLIDGQRGSMWIRPSPDRPRPYEMISSDKQEVKAMLAAEHKPRHIMLADWYADDVEVQAIQYRDTGVEPFCASSIIFNSKGRTRCFSGDDVEKYDAEHSRNSHGCLPPPLGWGTVNEPRECKETQTDMEIYQAEDGDEFLFMNFIHGGSHHSLRVSIDEHEMWIVAADGDFVQPRKVNVSNLTSAGKFRGIDKDRLSILVWQSASAFS